ncbi:MAG: AmmeMemoRadiSam system protein A [bacterium]
MGIVWGGIAPHPPIVVPEVGRAEIGKVSSTRAALQKLAQDLKAAKPEAVIITSPHGPVFSDVVAVSLAPRFSGSFSRFGAPGVRLHRASDLTLAQAIVSESEALKVPVAALTADELNQYGITGERDHGVLVPLYYLEEAGVTCPLVWIGMSLLPPEEIYAFGVAVQRAAEKVGKRVAFLASGDLSHRLTRDAPAGYQPEGARFDRMLVDKVRDGDLEGLLRIDPALADKAGECGWRSFMMLAGALDGRVVAPEVLSYEGPFGVGYLVAKWRPLEAMPGLRRLERLRGARGAAMAERRSRESTLVRLARETLEAYVRTGKRLPLPDPLPPELRDRAGVFVSLKKNGQLRGCIGTTEPTQPNLALEIQQNAVSAGTRDPRFWPVQPEELSEIVYSVDVLGKPEPVKGLEDLDPKRYGVIVSARGRRGLLLPDLEGIDSAEEQVAIAKQKAGLGPGDDVKLERFEVKRYY